ncbi:MULTISPECIES: sensor histidine kinase [unclassified Sphingobacterium]|uniref:sensor histidine kinase n=1 Tax=unclassified Sphingobacterium TaxID=2609468 RepID=UPI001053DD96|nr:MULTISPECIES: ATP-binding protein [unclassified Sphingobacterium]MCS3552660.1 signal transduction histidine kinase [Sphingobacterium sp. JUb21]TCR10580.1 signal transduction histidine kinase [Sphingobacterium sp. JUb20]
MDIQLVYNFHLLFGNFKSNLAIWRQQETIVLWIFLAILFVCVVLGFLIRIFFLSIKHQFENKLASSNLIHAHEIQLQLATINSVEHERKRLAAELHDAILSQLTIIRMKIQMDTDLALIDQKLEYCIEDTRRISHDLFPPMLEEKLLEELLWECLSVWKKKFTISIRNDVRHQKIFAMIIKLHVVRIMQELCMNIFKHADASTIDARIRITEKRNIIYIADNGKGFDTKKEIGLGLKNIQNRIKLIHGNYKIKHGGGTRFIIIF